MRYVANGGKAKTDSLDKEMSSANSKEGEDMYTEAVLYHSVGPDTTKTRAGINSHVYAGDHLNHVYQYAETGWEGQTRRMATESTTCDNPDTKVGSNFYDQQ